MGQHKFSGETRRKDWRHALPAHRRAHYADYMRGWEARNPGWKSFMKSLRERGLTLDQYHALNEAQDFCCAICGEERPLAIDHCHVAEKARGLLCRACNSALGFFRDSTENLARALAYVDGHRPAVIES